MHFVTLPVIPVSVSVFLLTVQLYIEIVTIVNQISGKYNGILIGAVPASSMEVQRNDVGDLWLTLSEKEDLEEVFKERVWHHLPEEFMKSDYYLIRWLRARGFNIAAAEQLLFENLRWRQEASIRNILCEDFSDVAKDFALTTDTHDRKYRPVGTVNLGTWNLRAAGFIGKLYRVSRYVDRFLEQLMQQILAAQQDGKEVTRAVVLVDLEGFGYSLQLCPSCMSLFRRWTEELEVHYPQFWEYVVFVNAPNIFWEVLDVVEDVMSPQTKAVIRVFGSDKKQWQHYLLDRIEHDQLYPNFGGKKETTTIMKNNTMS